MVRRAWGIARSMAMYHGIPAGTAGWRGSTASSSARVTSASTSARTWAAGCGPGARLGARVIAVEPQPDCLRVLRLLFGRDRGSRSCPRRVGAAAGRARLAVSTATPTVSSMSPAGSTPSRRTAASRGCAGTASVEVEVTTLDDLIAQLRRAGLLQDRRRGLRGRRAGRAEPAAARAVVRVPAGGARRRRWPRWTRVERPRATTGTTTRRSRHAVRQRPVAGRGRAGPAARPVPAAGPLGRRLRQAQRTGVRATTASCRLTFRW